MLGVTGKKADPAVDKMKCGCVVPLTTLHDYVDPSTEMTVFVSDWNPAVIRVPGGQEQQIHKFLTMRTLPRAAHLADSELLFERVIAVYMCRTHGEIEFVLAPIQ